MKNFIIGILTLLLMVSCNNISGVLDVDQDITLKGKKGPVNLAAGRYDAAIKFKSKKKFYLILKDEDKDDDIKITFRIPKGTDLPQRNGSFSLDAVQVKQPYGLNGEVETVTYRGETVFRSESCSYRVSDWQCYYDRWGQRICRTVYRTVYGYQRVRYHYLTSNRTIEITLVDPQDSDNQVALFSGADSDTEKIYEFIGRCR